MTSTDTAPVRAESEPEAPLRAVHTANFPGLLRELGASLLVTTYQAGKLVMVRDEGDHLNTHFRSFQAPMGLALDRGPTQTIALLPGSPAIGGGTDGTGVPATDQRGQSRSDRIDIGAFESQGFKLTPATNSTFQSTPVNEPFKNPLAVTVTANNAVEPVDGGVITFVAPSAGASATLSAATAVIAGGQASVTAKANATPGRFFVTAAASGAATVAFPLTNTEAPSLVLSTTRDVMDEFDDLTSLREAIAYANSHPGPDTITFDPSFFGKTPRTIVLTGGSLVLTDPATTTIVGPDASLLTISGGVDLPRLFRKECGEKLAHRSFVFDY